MLCARQWRAAAPRLRSIARTSSSHLVSIRQASLSAIHRGLKRTGRAQLAETSSRKAPNSRDRGRERSGPDLFTDAFSKRRVSGHEPSRPKSVRAQAGGARGARGCGVRAHRDHGRRDGGRSKRDSGQRGSDQPDHNERGRSQRGGRGHRVQDKTSEALDGASSERQRHKLRKKLSGKDAKDEQNDSGRQTRRKRFMNPQSSFGKQSLVYQVKYGALKDAAAALPLPEPGWSMQSRSAALPLAESRRPVQPSPPSLPLPESRRPVKPRPASLPRATNRAEETSAADGNGDKGVWRDRDAMPMSIKYTTAASQFLYGKSVVQAALKLGRRKLYQLYLYGGETRKFSDDDALMTRLAESRGVPIKIVPAEKQHLMDRMSKGRPHNGFVLETSPLPQLRVVSLGQLEESPTRLGFHVELDHQTKEEEAINGTDTFVPRWGSRKPKPFVLLLNEVLDPGNLGALLRTASYLGVDAVGITSRNSSALTPVVLKAASGATEELTLFTVGSPVDFLQGSKKAGWKTYAAIAPPERKLVRLHGDKFISTETIEQESPLKHNPCVLVLGNEGFGLPRNIKVASDFELSIPPLVRSSSVDSLNVSVAAGLLCHAFIKGCAGARAEIVDSKGSAEDEVQAEGELHGERMF